MPMTIAVRLRVVPLPLVLLLSAASAPAAGAQTVSLFGGRVHFAGEASGTFGSEDRGYFDYSDYATSRLRLLRLDLAAEARLSSFASLLAELRSDNLGSPRVYALYARLSPWPGHAFDVQAGLVPPVFGALPRRRYAADDPLPSLPLVYQYLTDLRYDAIPARVEDVVSRRGRGWLVRYPIGSTVAEPGLPLVSAERWDTGVEVRLGREPASLALALTQGSPSHPKVRDDNGGKQLAARFGWTSGPALNVGVSAATAEFLSREALAALPAGARRRNRQQALGFDADWSAGYWILRGEVVWSRWALPAVEATRIEAPLAALGAYLEARYKIRPGLFAAARVERLGFAETDSTLGRQTWDAPVTRLEMGGGYALRRHVLLKASWQHNQRDGGRVRKSDLASGQVLLWF